MRARTFARKAILPAAVIALTIWQRNSIVELLGIVSDQDAVTAYVHGFGFLGPLVLFLLLVAQVFIALIPGHALMVAAGYVYGLTGLATVIASTVLGSQIAFLLARRYGRGLIHWIASPKVIERWDSSADHQGILFYFLAFILPVFPGDLMCYVAGLGRISAGRFFISNLLGRTCSAVFITLIGMYGLHLPAGFWLAAVLSLFATAAAWLIFKAFTNDK